MFFDINEHAELERIILGRPHNQVFLSGFLEADAAGLNARRHTMRISSVAHIVDEDAVPVLTGHICHEHTVENILCLFTGDSIHSKIRIGFLYMQILIPSRLKGQALRNGAFYAIIEKTGRIPAYCRDIEMKTGGFGENVKGAGALIALVPLHLLFSDRSNQC